MTCSAFIGLMLLPARGDWQGRSGIAAMPDRHGGGDGLG
jgi:hypothetical protein